MASVQEIAAFCRKKGFIYPSYEIETANIMHELVFKASGHLEHFYDPIIRCTSCNFQERADLFLSNRLKKRVEGLSAEQLTELIKKHKLACPKCSSSFQPVSNFNMMFPLQLGTGTAHKGYLRPETAQSPYVNFKLQY